VEYGFPIVLATVFTRLQNSHMTKLIPFPFLTISRWWGVSPPFPFGAPLSLFFAIKFLDMGSSRREIVMSFPRKNPLSYRLGKIQPVAPFPRRSRRAPRNDTPRLIELHPSSFLSSPFYFTPPPCFWYLVFSISSEC